MHIQTQTKFDQFQGDELSALLKQMTFKINYFGLWESRHEKNRHYISNDIEIVYYIKGGTRTMLGDKEYHCPEKSFLILEPYQLNTSLCDDEDDFTYYYFHFDIEPVALQHQFLSLLTKHGNLVYGNEVMDFKETFDRLLDEVEDKQIGYASVITSVLIHVIVELTRAQLKRASNEQVPLIHSPYVKLVSDAMRYIQSHLYEPIRLAAVSRALGVSISVLYKAFIDVLDVPPSTYIQQQKILVAQKKLVNGESLSHISEELGFSSAYHLSRVFKQVMGVSPREFKKNIHI